MTLYVGPIVEGQTEERCVERLLHRVWAELLSSSERLQVVAPFRGRRPDLVHPNGETLGDKVRQAHVKLMAKVRKDDSARILLLILLDAEEDCPATLAPRLFDVATQALPPATPLSCVLAKRMLENWIVAGASTLAGVNGLPDPLPVRNRFEEQSGAAWLKKQLRDRDRKRTYKKTVDAELFVRSMNLAECRTNNLSFDKLCRTREAQLRHPPV